MSEEHGFQSADGGHRLCANNCGFFGSPATQNYCSKCYRDICQKEPQSATDSIFAAAAAAVALPPAAATVVTSAASVLSGMEDFAKAEAAVVQQPANRCSTCRKKVGLTGFRCRCGVTFCGAHRYPEMHGCSFDFKALGREAIAKANPLVKAEKLEKI